MKDEYKSIESEVKSLGLNEEETTLLTSHRKRKYAENNPKPILPWVIAFVPCFIFSVLVAGYVGKAIDFSIHMAIVWPACLMAMVFVVGHLIKWFQSRFFGMWATK
jgi:hypothetical protein